MSRRVNTAGGSGGYHDGGYAPGGTVPPRFAPAARWRMAATPWSPGRGEYTSGSSATVDSPPRPCRLV